MRTPDDPAVSDAGVLRVCMRIKGGTMLSNKVVRWIVVVVCLLSVYGCAPKEPAPAPQPAPTKTAAEYKAEADKQINEQNAADELSKLEQEVNAEAAQP